MWWRALCVCLLAAAATPAAVAVACGRKPPKKEEGTPGSRPAVINTTPTPSSSNQTTTPENPVVNTPAGSIRGSWMETRRGRRFQAYRGIRYAKPPIGKLRFKPPVPIVQYKEEVDASKEGPACPLVAPASYYVDEDCLTINVYTPTTNRSARLPVVFFIHPGGFYSMTGRSDLAGPHYLLDKNLIFVSINYRLAALGFLSTGDELAPGNNGMKDQVMALRWVQRNIAAFGGDPDRVTIAGVSAGSISVMLHMISPMTKGLFHRGIAISASPIGKEPMPHHQLDLAIKQAHILSCPTNSSQAIVDCLVEKPWKELGDSYPKFFQYAFDPVGLWKPVVELDFGQERYLTIEPTEAITKGLIHTVPLIVSQTTDEFAGLAFPILSNATLIHRMNTHWESTAAISFDLPRRHLREAARALRGAYLADRDLANDDFSKKQLGTLYGDAIVGFPTHRMANLMCKHSKHPVWYYEFAYVGAQSHTLDPATKKPVGAAHHDDMLYLLSLRYRFQDIPVSNSSDSAMVDSMTAVWYNFARYGAPDAREDTPELSSMKWPQMKPESREYLVFDKKFEVRKGYT
ncbi:venom carboxylesterase-6-like isoform X2 [Hyposmocoma kahamanoa]|uniref:venom carboxylesterase-6-like isoform X2 n=1 Tax=Hyposmocoma kahamanoa TaxID=1477025 RepID=UPI000E6D5D1A|nr:venom carboxylesterase-6-like isoform X2 [Hyposmocoma kahamanoa]